MKSALLWWFCVVIFGCYWRHRHQTLSACIDFSIKFPFFRHVQCTCVYARSWFHRLFSQHFFFQENIQLCRVVICRAFFWHVGVNACKALSANRMFGGFFFPRNTIEFFLCQPIKRQIEFIWIRLWCEWFRLIEMAFRFLHDNVSNQNSIDLQALFRVLITSTQRHKKQPFLNYNNDEDLSPTSVIRSTCKSFSKLFLLCTFHTLINKIT